MRSLGEAQQAHGHVYCEGEDVDAEPVAEFLFKYRSKGKFELCMLEYLTYCRCTKEADGNLTPADSRATGGETYR
jgi:hypothetical protein